MSKLAWAHYLISANYNTNTNHALRLTRQQEVNSSVYCDPQIILSNTVHDAQLLTRFL